MLNFVLMRSAFCRGVHEVTLFEARSRIFLPTASLAWLYSAAASPAERLRSDGSLAIMVTKGSLVASIN